MNFKTHVKPLVCLGVFGSALSLIFVRYSQAEPFAMLFFRFTMAMFMLGIPIIAKKRNEIINTFRTEYKMFFISGILFIAQMITWILAIRNTSIASCVVISNCHPLFVVFISVVFLKEKFPKRALFGAFITVIGCSVMSIMDFFTAENHLFGDVFAFLTAFIWALYLLYAKKIRKTTSVSVYMILTYGVAYFIVIAYVIITQEPLFVYPPVEYFYFFVLALFSTVMGQGLVDWGLGYVTASFASLAFLLEPVFSICLAMILLKEFPSVLQVICAAAILYGIYIFNKFEDEVI